MQDKIAYSIAEITEQTSLSRDLLYDAMRRGDLQYVKVGARRIITRAALDAFLAASAVTQ
jgi:excisionase family DNA binding protein